MATNLSKLFEFILPKGKMKAGGVGQTNTFDPSNVTEPLSLPEYTEHLKDIQDTRLSDNSLELIKEAMKVDPDVSAAVNAYLTLSDTDLDYVVRDSSGEISGEGQKILNGLMYRIFTITDYTLGYQHKPSLHEFVEGLRYMLLMRGSVGVELVYDKTSQPETFRIVDMATVEFVEKSPGVYKPIQSTDNVEDVNLDIPTFFTSRFKQDPTEVYSYSYFTSAINTIAARQAVINDLYRIMRIVGFPRITLKVLEEVLKNRCPKEYKSDSRKFNEWVNSQVRLIANQFNDIRPDMPFAHTDSVEPSILNEKQPGAGLQVEEIISTLNAQNQAGLKVVATVLGRGEAGVNTASVESRIFSLSADSLNKPIADILSRAMTLALRLSGFDGFAVFKFKPAELRPDLELESMRIQKQTRLMKDLSLGIISDETYVMEMYGETPRDGAPQLSGTNFLDKKEENSTSGEEGTEDTKRDNSLGRSLTPDDADSADSNINK